MFYIVEVRYVGEEREQLGASALDRLEIRATPARVTGTGEPRYLGWCGPEGDYEECAHGQFRSLEDAHAELHGYWGRAVFGWLSAYDPSGQRLESEKEDALEVYRKIRPIASSW